jgi:putative hydrolase of the HAD superfamily
VKHRAVVFDLFGTLVRNFSRREYGEVLAEVAAAVGAPAERFLLVWLETFPERTLGGSPTVKGAIGQVCELLGVKADDAQLARAARTRLDYTRRHLAPREGAVETLAELRRRGLLTGLITDCTVEVPLLWGQTLLAPLIDAAVFSSVAHLRKPDPAIYHLLCEQLQVRPEECVYVGDGGSRELTGARRAGMRPVMLRAPGEEDEDVHRVDAEGWEGAAIAALGDVLPLISGDE